MPGKRACACKEMQALATGVPQTHVDVALCTGTTFEPHRRAHQLYSPFLASSSS
jgi:hypothetical protein